MQWTITYQSIQMRYLFDSLIQIRPFGFSLSFERSSDYIFILSDVLHSTYLGSLVVERSSIRGFAADFPLKKRTGGFNLVLIQLIFSAFATFTVSYISYLRCSLTVFRNFQQFKGYISPYF